MIDFEAARIDPASAFQAPEDISNSSELTREQKIELLSRWEYDARELEVATEEGMQNEAEDLLKRIHEALRSIGGKLDLEKEPPTKQGGL